MNPDTDDPVPASLVCHTEGCVNEGVAIELNVSPDAETRLVFCGPCGQPITDVTIPPPAVSA